MNTTPKKLRAATIVAALPLLSASVEAQSCLADPWEPDDICVNANVVVTDSLCRADATVQIGDDDWYEITLQQGERLEMAVRAEEGAILELAAFSNCNPIALTSDLGNSPSFQITNGSAQALVLQIRIELIVGVPQICASYDLSMNRTTLTSDCDQDDFEPNQCIDAAASISEGHHTGLNVHPDNPDWYEIEVFGRKSLEFVVPTTVPDVQLQLFDENGVFLDFDSNIVRVTKDTLVGRTYRLLVINTGAMDSCSSYSLHVNVLDEIQQYCFGSGDTFGGCTLCPCSNDTNGGVAGCVNSQGIGAAIDAQGDASVANDTLNFVTVSAVPNTFAILISGDFRAPNTPDNPCFGQASGITSISLDGLRCTVGNLVRHGSRATDEFGNVGFTNARWGPPDGPIGGLLAQGGFAAGQARNFQAFYRESVDEGCGTGQNTTQAIHVIVHP